MNKKTKGFSLAELLISLLVISIVLAAAMPTLTARLKNQREAIWAWTKENNGTYFGLGDNNGVYIGYNTSPLESTSLSDVFYDAASSDVYSNYTYSSLTSSDEPSFGSLNASFSQEYDKLYIVRRNHTTADGSIINSQISFYTAPSGGGTTTSDIEYAGRLSLDRGSVALGIGSLQNLTDSSSENTALGHFTLFENTKGLRNTAVGKKALSLNQSGNYNTALGFAALFKMDSGSSGDYNNSENTAVGTMAMENLLSGLGNTAIGSQAMKNGSSGSLNTAIGFEAFKSLGGSESNNNIAIGSYACSNLTSGSNNICIGYDSGNSVTEDNYGLYIGTEDDPLISGHIKSTLSTSGGSTTGDKKELIVDAEEVTFNIDEEVDFNINDNTIISFDSASKSLSTATSSNNVNYIYSYDTNNYPADISLNNALYFDFPPLDSGANSTYTKNGIGIRTPLAYSSLVLNNQIYITDDSNDSTALYFDSNGFSLTSPSSGVIRLVNTNNEGIYIENGKFSISTAGNAIFTNSDVYIESSLNNFRGYVGLEIKNLQNTVNRLQGIYSDARLKNISGDNTSGLKEINEIEVKNFTFKDDKEKTPHVGVIAQQLQKVFPNSVFKDEDGYYRIQKDEMFYAMLNSIKELFAKIQDLAAKITGLDKRITELEEQNKTLIEQNKAFEKQNTEFEKRLAKLEKKNSK